MGGVESGQRLFAILFREKEISAETRHQRPAPRFIQDGYSPAKIKGSQAHGKGREARSTRHSFRQPSVRIIRRWKAILILPQVRYHAPGTLWERMT